MNPIKTLSKSLENPSRFHKFSSKKEHMSLTNFPEKKLF
jgi:hypothetical protein